MLNVSFQNEFFDILGQHNKAKNFKTERIGEKPHSFFAFR